jgi:hypothetical protein
LKPTSALTWRRLLPCPQDNAFSGPFPLNRTNMRAAVIRLRNNYFGGSLPEDVNYMPVLLILDVTNNRCLWAPGRAPLPPLPPPPAPQFQPR